MKICLITEHFPPHIGGVEIVFEEYAKRLTRRGHQVKVITSNSGKVSGTKKINGYEVHYAKCKSFFGHPVIPKNVIKKYAAWADIFHTTTYTAALPSLKVARQNKKPCILMVHEVLNKRWFFTEKNPIKALGFFSFEKFVIHQKYSIWQAISEATRKDLLACNIPKNKIKLVRHGIDYSVWNKKVKEKNLEKFFKINTKTNFFLYNGRPGKTKGIFILLKAINKIKDQVPENFKFSFIIGKEPEVERNKFEKLVIQYNLEKIVKITNSLPYLRLPGYRKAAFSLIVPSLTEGFGFVAAETCALGTPLIISNSGSLPEVANGKVLTFKNGDPKDLAEKILLAMKNKFNRIPEKKFEWDNSINKIEKIYKELI